MVFGEIADMKLFQVLALALLGVLTSRELLGVSGGAQRGRWFRACLLCAAAVAIVWPQTTQWVARGLGIDRGADLVHYLGVLAFIAVAFHLYARNFALEQQLTELIRQRAIDGAQFQDLPAESRQAWNQS